MVIHAQGYKYKNYGLINHLNTISGYYSITAKCITDTVKSYETLGMQYADKYHGLDQRLGLLSLCGVKYMTVLDNSMIARNTHSKDNVPYAMTKIKKKSYYTIYKNPYALPFAYGYDNYITQDQYDQLNGVEREQAMLSSIVLDEKADNRKLEHKEKITDSHIKITPIQKKNISSKKGKKYCEITIPTQKGKESYLYFKGLVYRGTSGFDVINLF